MMLDFTLHVENFGRIGKADIRVTDFTLFIGDNNSGKSYLMTLIYGIISGHLYSLVHSNLEKGEIFITPMLNDLFSKKIDKIIITSDHIIQLENIINAKLSEKKEQFIRDLFNRKVNIGKLELQFPVPADIELVISWDSARSDMLSLKFEIDGDEKESLVFSLDETNDITTLGESLSVSCIDCIIDIAFNLLGINPVFLPASRTGFMLGYKSMIKSSLSEAFGNGSAKGKNDTLTLPVIEFLKDISIEERDASEENDIIPFIEKNILGGKIIVKKSPVLEYYYQPDGVKEAFPLFLSSGIITEIAPLVAFLEDVNVTAIMIEEPEMCLHPALQKQMARVLIRTVNSYLPVIAATHSDIIIQHINNMIKIYNHPDKHNLLEKFGYDEDDLIDLSAVSVYQFSAAGSKSTIEKIEWSGENGFRAETFVSLLNDMLNETIDIENGK